VTLVALSGGGDTCGERVVGRCINQLVISLATLTLDFRRLRMPALLVLNMRGTGGGTMAQEGICHVRVAVEHAAATVFTIAADGVG
jgi:hypothetical protein